MSTHVHGRQLVGRETLTDATCIGGFDWANNVKGLGPCLIAAQVMGSCNGGDWKIPQLTGSGAHYVPPNATTANLCSCSWAAYNLLNACTACQGLEASMFDWEQYRSQCAPEHLSNTYFPTAIEFVGTPFIPYWSGTNPLEWTDIVFNVSQARGIAGQNYPNLISTSKWQGSLPKPRPRPSIAMGNVGSILGGLSGLMLVIDVIVYVKYRERMREREAEITRNTAAPRQGKRYGKPYFAPSLRNSALGEPVQPASTSRLHMMTTLSFSNAGGLPLAVGQEVPCPMPVKLCDSSGSQSIIVEPRFGTPPGLDMNG